SEDGGMVAFVSDESLSGAGNEYDDVFISQVRSRRRAYWLVRAALHGTDDADSYSPWSLSGDGGLVAFASTASNLVAGDNNRCDDIFVRDRGTRSTARVSLGNLGGE